ADAALRVRDVPGGSEPERKRRASAGEDRPGGRRAAPVAGGAANESVAHPPTRPASTSGADEALRPAQPLEVGETRSIVWKPAEQLTPALRLVDTGPGMKHELRLFGTKDSKGNSPLAGSGLHYERMFALIG